MEEYAILDTIYYYSNNVKFNGWCIASKQTIANDLDVSERTVFRAIETCVEKGFIEKGEKGTLRTTDSWNEMMANKHDWYIAFNGKENQFISGKNTLKNDPDKLADTMTESQPTLTNWQNDPDKLADKHNREHNNKQSVNNIGDKSPTPSQTMKDFLQIVSDKTERYEEFVKAICLKWNLVDTLVRGELDKFASYWSELTKDGKRQRWETEKVFEVQRRLGTWFGNINKFTQKQDIIPSF